MKNRSNQVRRAAFAAVETLEQRRMLSSSPTVALIDNGDGTQTLKVTGTKNADKINVYDDPQNGEIIVKDVTHNKTWTEDYSNGYINVVLVDVQQGDDCVNYELESSYDNDQRSIQVDLSDGNDKFHFYSPSEITGTGGDDNFDPDGADILDHSSINIEVDGQEKNDTIDIDLTNTSVEESSLLVNVDAGAGNDTVSFETPLFFDDEGVGDDVSQLGLSTVGGSNSSDYTQIQLQVDLGTGNNLYSQYLFTEFDFAQLTINVNGNSGKDTVQAEDHYDLSDDSGYFFTANLEGGNDYYNGELGDTAVESGSEATYNLQGGDGNDRMTLEGFTNETPAVTPPPDPELKAADVNETEVFPEFVVNGILNVNMYGGTGNDTMDMWADQNSDEIPINNKAVPHIIPASTTPGGQTLPMFIETNEGGDVRVVESGDAGNDKVGLFLGATADSEGDYDLSVLGAAGKDTLGAGFIDDTLLFQGLPAPINLAKPALIPEIDSAITFGPSGAILVDGGRDSDQYDTESTSYFGIFFPTPFSVRSCETLKESILPDVPTSYPI